MINDRFMGTFYHDPLLLRKVHLFLYLVGNDAAFSLDHIADVYLIGKNIGHRKIPPQG